MGHLRQSADEGKSQRFKGLQPNMMQESYAYSESMPRFETEDEAIYRTDMEPRNYFGRKASMDVKPTYEKPGYEKEAY